VSARCAFVGAQAREGTKRLQSGLIKQLRTSAFGGVLDRCREPARQQIRTSLTLVASSSVSRVIAVVTIIKGLDK